MLARLNRGFPWKSAQFHTYSQDDVPMTAIPLAGNRRGDCLSAKITPSSPQTTSRWFRRDRFPSPLFFTTYRRTSSPVVRTPAESASLFAMNTMKCQVYGKKELWRLPGLSLSPENHLLGAWFQEKLMPEKKKKT